ncbi:sigma-70 family RNA polymerase sigma factor [Roseovarius tibetensis]|uniref:sigma-70 family RNA polymerase sigma factor n=1 Tax=Roseovarius tibetensis TaxID=2685897 RepID=UPI003D7F7033
MNKPVRHWATGSRAKSRAGMLSAQDEGDLLRAWQQHGDRRSRDLLLRAFAPLAGASAARFSATSGEADPDLLQQANIGLMKAADRFDPAHGTRFATYAVWWIRAEIQAFRRANMSVVRRPNSPQIRKAAAHLSRLDAEVSNEADSDSLESEMRIAEELGVSIERLVDLRAQLSVTDQSLNIRPSGPDGDESIALLADPATTDIPERVHPCDVDVLRAALVQTLSDLPEREREIVLATELADPPATLAVLGARFGISRERVRQLRERGLARLRQSLRQRGLAPECFI